MRNARGSAEPSYEPHVSPAVLFKMVSVMMELNNLIARQEMRWEQFIIHVRENKTKVEVERMYLLALLEDLARLKAERQRLEDQMELRPAA